MHPSASRVLIGCLGLPGHLAAKMSIKFREEPKGDVELKMGGIQVLQGKRKLGLVCKNQPKMVFSAESVRRLAGRGCWFEMRVDDYAGGEVNLLAIGFTATDPETLVAKAEGDEAPEEASLPGRASSIARTYVCGYMRSLYWEGQRIEIDPIFKKLKPLKIFTIGALANAAGGLEIYINRRLVHSFDPSEAGLPPIDSEVPLWAVVDCCNGLKKACLNTDSVPPTPEEAVAPEEDEDADGGGDGAQEKDAEEAEEAAEGGGETAEGDAEEG